MARVLDSFTWLIILDKGMVSTARKILMRIYEKSKIIFDILSPDKSSIFIVDDIAFVI